MMAGGLREDACAMYDAPAFGILSGKPQGFNPRHRHRRRAHGAGFERNPQGALIESRGAELRRSRADRLHFGMRRRVIAGAHRISAFRNDLVAKRDDGANRNLTGCSRFTREVERTSHRRWKRKSHARAASRAGASSHIVLFVAAAAWF